VFEVLPTTSNWGHASPFPNGNYHHNNVTDLHYLEQKFLEQHNLSCFYVYLFVD